MTKIKYKKCPKCGAIMKVREDVMTSSMPPKYIYNCPKCNWLDFDVEKYPYETSISSISGESRIMTREMIEGRLLQNDTESWNEDYNEEDLQTRFAFYTYKNEPGALYLSNLFVEEASRNRGLGTKILKAAEKVAETIGASSIGLKVKQDSPANAWYRKNGYGYVASEDGYDWLEKSLE